MDNLECTGHENSLSECEFNGWGEEDCGHHEDASVICEPGEEFRTSVVFSIALCTCITANSSIEIMYKLLIL